MAENKGVKVNTTYNEYLEGFLNFKRHYIFKEPYILNIIGIRKMHDYSDVLAETNLKKRQEIIKKSHDTFDDTLVVFYYDETKKKIVDICDKFTTHPGLHWLYNTGINDITGKKYIGTAILCEGQYINYWIKGNHKGYDSIVQKSYIKDIKNKGKFKNDIFLKVYRDNNEDGMLNLELKNIWDKDKYPLEGGADIDIHRANPNPNFTSSSIDKWSAGCQVLSDYAFYKKLLKLRDLQIKKGKNSNADSEAINYYNFNVAQDDINKKEFKIDKNTFSYTLICEEELKKYIKDINKK